MDLNKRKIISSCIFFFLQIYLYHVRRKIEKEEEKKKVIVPIGKRDYRTFDNKKKKKNEK